MLPNSWSGVEVADDISVKYYYQRNTNAFWSNASDNYTTVVADKIYSLIKL